MFIVPFPNDLKKKEIEPTKLFKYPLQKIKKRKTTKNLKRYTVKPRV